jgi:hypothetical protein
MKAVESIHVTLDGIESELNDDDSKAWESMRFNDDGKLNEIDSRYRQNAKHFEQKISTVFGIIIERNDDDSNADDSIRFKMMVIQTKLIREICKWQSYVSTISEHMMELQSIAMMMIQMQMGQFVSMMTFDRRKLIQCTDNVQSTLSKEMPLLME